MKKLSFDKLTNQQAYQQLHEALLAVMPRHVTQIMQPKSFAETTLETAVTALTALQMALLAKMDEDQDRTSKS